MDIVVIGGSDQGRCTIDIVERSGVHRVVGVIDDHAPVGSEISGRPVLGRLADLATVVEHHRVEGGIAAVGDNHVRSILVAQAEAAVPGFRWPALVDPTAHLAPGIDLGEGTVLMAGTVVNIACQVGRHVLLCAGAQLDHDGSIADFASMGPGAVAGGGVTIGAFSNVGLGASVIHGRTIGEQTVVGAGSTVVRDVEAFVVAYGSPCRVVRPRSAGDRYL